MFVLFVSLNHLLAVERKFNCRTLGNGRLRENLKLYVRIRGCKDMLLIILIMLRVVTWDFTFRRWFLFIYRRIRNTREINEEVEFFFFSSSWIAEPSFGIDTQGLATFEAEQCVLVTEEPSVSPVPTVSAAECYATSACASSSIADTPKHTPDTVFRAQSTPQAGGEHEPETGGVRSQQIYLEHGWVHLFYFASLKFNRNSIRSRRTLLLDRTFLFLFFFFFGDDDF